MMTRIMRTARAGHSRKSPNGNDASSVDAFCKSNPNVTGAVRNKIRPPAAEKRPSENRRPLCLFYRERSLSIKFEFIVIRGTSAACRRSCIFTDDEIRGIVMELKRNSIRATSDENGGREYADNRVV